MCYNVVDMNTRQAARFQNMAREIANTMDTRQIFRHVSIVISGKSIVAIGTNSGKTHTLAREKGYRTDYVHSELDAFSKIRYREGSFILINFRFNRRGQLRNSRPCVHCMPWCAEFFDEIYYSCNDGRMRSV